jgi:hypothetical protein
MGNSKQHLDAQVRRDHVPSKCHPVANSLPNDMLPLQKLMSITDKKRTGENTYIDGVLSVQNKRKCRGGRWDCGDKGGIYCVGTIISPRQQKDFVLLAYIIYKYRGSNIFFPDVGK